MEGWAWMRGMGDGGGGVEHYRHEGGGCRLGTGRGAME